MLIYYQFVLNHICDKLFIKVQSLKTSPVEIDFFLSWIWSRFHSFNVEFKAINYPHPLFLYIIPHFVQLFLSPPSLPLTEYAVRKKMDGGGGGGGEHTLLSTEIVNRGVEASGPDAGSLTFSVRVRRRLPDLLQSVNLKYVKLGYHYLINHAIYLLATMPLLAIAFGSLTREEIWDDASCDLASLLGYFSVFVFTAFVYYMSRPRPIYLIDFACYRPSDDLKVIRLNPIVSLLLTTIVVVVVRKGFAVLILLEPILPISWLESHSLFYFIFLPCYDIMCF